ncbi:sulfotransferase [Phenylobacterium sp. LjRoot219]|uniref:sulfotransferase family protein n=1 Tax=Phenylobacterium sp. LjRoot219 TaxID=3342283 RepID=UPI003ECC7EE7
MATPVTVIGSSACPDADGLMELAYRRTGLGDFGAPARNAGLHAFAAGLRGELWQAMPEAAREQVVEYAVHMLATRLKLIDDRKRHPQIAAQQITRPLIVVGPPRSGSTLLHTLLSLDPEAMAPEHWICLEPSPPLALGPPSQARLDQAGRRMMSLFERIPDIFVTHPYMIEEGSGALAECGSDILNMVFSCQQLWCLYRAETFRRYLLDADHTAALGFHHDFLQHIQWGGAGKHWALKGSDYLLRLEEVAAQYPDATLIWTHRDLAQQLGSLANIQAILTGVAGEPVSGAAREAVGRLAIEHQRASFEKGMRARDRIGEDRFLDISYHDVMANPVRTVERIYARCGRQMSEAHRAAIDEWLRQHPQTKHGVHKYAMDEFGLGREATNRQFQDYVERFGFGYGLRPPLTE